MKTITYHFIVLIMTYSTCLIAQQQDSWITFTTADGLANNQVQAVLESRDGTLWFGTLGGGVSRYQDGIWKTFKEADGLADNTVLGIVESSDGLLWFCTSKGVSCLRDGLWTSFTTEDGLVDNHVNAILESGDGALWFGTYKGVSRYYNGIWTDFTTHDGLANNQVNAILESHDGALWFGTFGNGISRYQNGLWTTFETADGLADNSICAIFQSRDGAMWFGTTGGVSCYQEGIWKNFTTQDCLVDNYIRAILESQNGALWFGTSGGVSRLQEGIWTSFTTANGLASNGVSTICESSDAGMWFGTDGGVSRYESAIWTSFTATDGLAGNSICAILESHDKALLFGTFNEGISRYQNGIWTKFSTINGLICDHIHAILQSSDGALWFGTGGGVSRYYDSIWTNFTKYDGLVDNDVNAILESSDGALWFGTCGGISRYQKGIWKSYTAADGLADNYVDSILESSDGTLWFGTCGPSARGISCYQDGVWTSFTTADGLANNYVDTIIESHDGSLWFGTWGGVSHYKNGLWTTFTIVDGLADNSVKAILESSDGALWIGTAYGGVNRYQDDLWITFNTADGLVDNYVQAILESRDGMLWFGTINGVSRLKPDKTPPFTIINSGPKNNEKFGISAPMFTFHGYDYRTSLEHLSYTYSVYDLNSYLIDGDYLNERVVQLNLPGNGNYTFKVQAIDSWGNIALKPATRTFAVDITPPTVTFNLPKSDDVVSNEVTIIGSAYDNSPLQDFSGYELSYAPTRDDTTRWLIDRFIYKNKTTDEIRDDTLAIWNTTGLPNGAYWLHLSARDKLGHISHDFVPIEIVTTCQFIDSRNGGYLCSAPGIIEIYIPPNAIPNDKQVNMKDHSIGLIEPIDNPKITFLNFSFEITPKEMQLSKPGTLSLIYPDSLINGKTEENLALYYSPDGKDNWQRLGGSVDLEKNKITTTFKQFGVFALYEDLTEGGKAGIFNVNSQPRIFSPQGGGYDAQTAISFELGKESNMTIKIYNSAGRLVKLLKENDQISHGNNVVYWDGKDEKGDFCMSGLYIVTIQTEEKIATKTVVVLNKY